MSLDELTLDGGEIGGTSSEAPSEKSEKQKESSRRAQAQLQKTQKDEKKAKGDNNDLFYILSRFIKNPFYEELIPTVVFLLQNAFPSRFILVIIALTYPEAAHYMYGKLGKSVSPDLYGNLYRYPQPHEFHDNTLDPTIRDWVTLWMGSAQEFLSQEDGSVILQQKILTLLSSSRKIAEDGIKNFFIFFLSTSNVFIAEGKAEAYAQFIIAEFEKILQEYLEKVDPDLKNQLSVDANDLFGIKRE